MCLCVWRLSLSKRHKYCTTASPIPLFLFAFLHHRCFPVLLRHGSRDFKQLEERGSLEEGEEVEVGGEEEEVFTLKYVLALRPGGREE